MKVFNEEFQVEVQYVGHLDKTVVRLIENTYTYSQQFESWEDLNKYIEVLKDAGTKAFGSETKETF